MKWTVQLYMYIGYFSFVGEGQLKFLLLFVLDPYISKSCDKELYKEINISMKKFKLTSNKVYFFVVKKRDH